MWGKIFYGVVIAAAVYLVYSNLDLIHSVENYEGETPKMEVGNFFSDGAEGWGMIYAIDGAIRSRFFLNFKTDHQNIDKNSLMTLNTNLTFDDGEKLQESFKMIGKDGGEITFESKNFPQRILLQQMGNSFQTKFTMSLDADRSYFSNTFVKMHCSLISRNVALCQANVKKMGFLLGKAFFTLHSLEYNEAFNKSIIKKKEELPKTIISKQGMSSSTPRKDMSVAPKKEISKEN